MIISCACQSFCATFEQSFHSVPGTPGIVRDRYGIGWPDALV